MIYEKKYMIIKDLESNTYSGFLFLEKDEKIFFNLQLNFLISAAHVFLIYCGKPIFEFEIYSGENTKKLDIGEIDCLSNVGVIIVIKNQVYLANIDNIDLRFLKDYEFCDNGDEIDFVIDKIFDNKRKYSFLEAIKKPLFELLEFAPKESELMTKIPDSVWVKVCESAIGVIYSASGELLELGIGKKEQSGYNICFYEIMTGDKLNKSAYY